MKLFFLITANITCLISFGQHKELIKKSTNSEINLLEFGAKKGLKFDNAKIFMAAIKALPETGGIIYIPAGTYLINTPVVVDKPIHFIGAGVQRYTDQSGYDYNAGTNLITSTTAGIKVFECMNVKSNKSSFKGSTFEGIGFEDESGKKNTFIYISMINNFRIFNCSFSAASKAIVVDAKVEDASWGEIQNCIFSFNDTAIDNKTSHGSVPNLHVSGGMFAIGKNQRGVINHTGQYVRLEGFKMDILGKNAVGIVWNGGTKGSLSNIGIELNDNENDSHAIQFSTQSDQKTILDVSLISVNITSDGTAGSMIQIAGKKSAYPITGIKIIGSGFTGGTVGIRLDSMSSNNLISGCSFRGFSIAAIDIDTGSNYNVLTDILNDRPPFIAGGIRDRSYSTIYNGFHWVNGGDRGTMGIRPAVVSENDRIAMGSPKTGELIFNITLGEYQFFNGKQWESLGRNYWEKYGDSNLRYAQGNVTIGLKDTDLQTSILTLNSSTKGFLPPRMSTHDKLAIKNPDEGLVIYDLNLHKLCVFTGTKWE